MIKYERLDDSSAFKYAITEDVYAFTGILGFELEHGDIRLMANGWLVLFAGYKWDGATLCPDWLPGMLPPLVHDALYELIQNGLLPYSYRDDADSLFKRMIRDDIGQDTCKPRKWLRWPFAGAIWACVRLFGGWHCKREHDKGSR